jgi:hypothetical protein
MNHSASAKHPLPNPSPIEGEGLYGMHPRGLAKMLAAHEKVCAGHLSPCGRGRRTQCGGRGGNP